MDAVAVEDLVARPLEHIQTFVGELRALGDLEAMRHDIVQERFIEHTLQLSIQAAINAAAYIIADRRLGEPRTNGEVFDLLKRYGWIPENLAAPLRGLTTLRNILIYEYDSVDLDAVEDAVRHHLDDLLAFVAAVRARI